MWSPCLNSVSELLKTVTDWSFRKGRARDSHDIVRKDGVSVSSRSGVCLRSHSERTQPLSVIVSFSLCHHLRLEHCICPCGQMSRGYQPSMGLRITKRKQWCLGCGPSTNWLYDYGTHFPSLNPSLLISEVKGQCCFISRGFFFPIWSLWIYFLFFINKQPLFT